MRSSFRDGLRDAAVVDRFLAVFPARFWTHELTGESSNMSGLHARVPPVSPPALLSVDCSGRRSRGLEQGLDGRRTEGWLAKEADRGALLDQVDQVLF